MSETTDQDQDQDRIERDIYVAASAEEVWALVSRPGWWINDGEVDDHPTLSVDGDLTTLTHPEWGDFALRTTASERPSYVAFRWLSAPSEGVGVDDLDGDGSTLVELWIEPKPGGVTLRVAESGFAQLADDPEEGARQRADNDEGWANELRAARDFVTAHRG